MIQRMLIEKVAVILLVAYPLTLLAAPARHVREAPSGPTSTTTTPGRWHQPCAGSNPVDPTMISPPQDFTSLPFNPQTHYQEIRDRALQSKDDTHALMQRYITERVQDHDILESLASIEHHNTPDIPGPVRRGDITNDTEYLLTSYGWLLQFAVFIEEMKGDEIIEKQNFGESRSFINDVLALQENAIYWLLCKIKTTIHGHNLTPESSVTQRIASETFHYIENRAQRDSKNIVILRDLKRALKHIHDALNLILETMYP